MKYKQLLLFPLFCITFSCSNNQQKVPPKMPVDSTITHTQVTQVPIKVEKDTLQFIHFDGNSDYWYAFFLTSKKDTLRLVTDKQFESKQLGKLLEVEWRPGTLSEAGDNEKKYSDKRLVNFREIQGVPFVSLVTEKRVLGDINSLIEVKENADNVWIAAKPDIEKSYYQVESETVNEDNNSRLFSFRVYVYPKYEIKIMDYSNNAELTLDQWRKNNQ